MPTYGPWRGYAGGPVQPIFINKAFKTLARRATQDLLRSGLARQAHEERRDQGKANLTRLS